MLANLLFVCIVLLIIGVSVWLDNAGNKWRK